MRLWRVEVAARVGEEVPQLPDGGRGFSFDGPRVTAVLIVDAPHIAAASLRAEHWLTRHRLETMRLVVSELEGVFLGEGL